MGKEKKLNVASFSGNAQEKMGKISFNGGTVKVETKEVKKSKK